MKPAWTPAQYAETVEALNGFALQDAAEVERARALLLGPEGDVHGPLSDVLFAWLTLGQEDAAGLRAVDRLRVLASSPTSEVPAAERAVLEALSAAWCSLFEVREVHPDSGMELWDLLGGERLFVREKRATEQAVRHDVLLAWVLPAGGHFELVGAGFWVPRSHLGHLVPGFREALARARARGPGEDVRVHLRRLAGRLCAREIALAAEPRPVLNMDDEPYRPCTALFRVADVAEAARALEGHSRFTREDAHTFSWLDAAGRPELGEGLLVLGQVRLRPGELRLETNSSERLERGHTLLSGLLGPALRHVEDTVGEQAVTYADAGRPLLLRGEARVHLLEALRRYVERLADVPLPHLGHLSPRQAVHTPRGRAQVLLLLADAENHLARQPGGEAIDLGPVYAALGLMRGELPDLDAAFAGTVPEPREPVRLDASWLPPSKPAPKRRRGRLEPGPTVTPGAWFAFKLGPIPLEPKDVNAYVAFASDTLKSSIVFDARDAEGMAKLARKLTGRTVYCELALASPGRKHGFVPRPLPGELLLVRATLALAFAWGPSAEEVLPEHIGELLLAAADLWDAAPWTLWENEAALTATLSGAARGERELMLLGNGEEEYGVVLFDEPGAQAHMAQLARSERYEEASHVPCLALNYDAWPEFAAEAVEDATGLPLFPAPLRLTHAGPGMASAADVRLLTATARALCALSAEHLEAQGEAGTGPQRVAVHVKAPPPLLR